jgi:hypothetical protein
MTGERAHASYIVARRRRRDGSGGKKRRDQRPGREKEENDPKEERELAEKPSAAASDNDEEKGREPEKENDALPPDSANDDVEPTPGEDSEDSHDATDERPSEIVPPERRESSRATRGVTPGSSHATEPPETTAEAENPRDHQGIREEISGAPRKEPRKPASRKKSLIDNAPPASEEAQLPENLKDTGIEDPPTIDNADDHEGSTPTKPAVPTGSEKNSPLGPDGPRDVTSRRARGKERETDPMDAEASESSADSSKPNDIDRKPGGQALQPRLERPETETKVAESKAAEPRNAGNETSAQRRPDAESAEGIPSRTPRANKDSIEKPASPSDETTPRPSNETSAADEKSPKPRKPDSADEEPSNPETLRRDADAEPAAEESSIPSAESDQAPENEPSRLNDDAETEPDGHETRKPSRATTRHGRNGETSRRHDASAPGQPIAAAAASATEADRDRVRAKGTDDARPSAAAAAATKTNVLPIRPSACGKIDRTSVFSIGNQMMNRIPLSTKMGSFVPLGEKP